MRRTLHEIAEPSGQESATASVIAGELEKLGLKVYTGLGGHGILGVLGDPPYTLVRAELDAVPARDGIGHHCGHDGHMAMLFAAIQAWVDGAPRRGGIAALFQPAEETGVGMRACLNDLRIQGLDIDRTFALHNVPGVPLGEAILRPGCKASVGMEVTWTGQSAHAAAPWEGASPWPQVATWATVCNTWPERDPLVTLVHVRLGEPAYGTSPGTAVAGATIRASSDEALQETWDRLVPTASADLMSDVRQIDAFPATVNDTNILDALADALQEKALPVHRLDDPFPWSEDFGFALQKWPGALVGIGSGLEQTPLHDAGYVFPDDLLEYGKQLWLTLGALP